MIAHCIIYFFHIQVKLLSFIPSVLIFSFFYNLYHLVNGRLTLLYLLYYYYYINERLDYL